ncbi:MAG: polyprenyl synthetase family protein [Verrucomicrobiota bacterium]
MKIKIDERLVGHLRAEFEGKQANQRFRPLIEAVIDVAHRPGKRVRPLLFLLSVQALRESDEQQGEIKESGLIDVAVALELMHAFILVHDDIIDRSEERRGRPSLHRLLASELPPTASDEVGDHLALVMGDVLFALAQRLVLQADLPAEIRCRLGERILGYMADTGFGENADILFSTRDLTHVGREEIEEMYWLKTTRYSIECPMVLAALLIGMEDRHCHDLIEVARPLGMAFQMQNDLKDFFVGQDSRGSIPNDLQEGKKTLLLREAWERLDGSDAEQGILQLCLSQRPPNDTTISMVQDLVVKSGAVLAMEERIQRSFLESQYRLEASSLSASQKEGVRSLVDLVKKVLSK